MKREEIREKKKREENLFKETTTEMKIFDHLFVQIAIIIAVVVTIFIYFLLE